MRGALRREKSAPCLCFQLRQAARRGFQRKRAQESLFFQYLNFLCALRAAPNEVLVHPFGIHTQTCCLIAFCEYGPEAFEVLAKVVMLPFAPADYVAPAG